MKLYRRKKENGIEDIKKRLDGNQIQMKQKRSSSSTIGAKMNGCLKKSNIETEVSIGNGRRADSVSTGLDSLNETTVTSWGSFSRPKKVSFATVEIRNYERIASDNPCCSSGPPIG